MKASHSPVDLLFGYDGVAYFLSCKLCQVPVYDWPADRGAVSVASIMTVMAMHSATAELPGTQAPGNFQPQDVVWTEDE